MAEVTKRKDGPLWWQKPVHETASTVRATIDSYDTVQHSRKQRWLRNIRLYEGRAVTDLNPASWYTENAYAGAEGCGYKTYRVNMSRSLVSTAMAKIAGKQRPKAAFCATDADWSVKRKAKKKERFCEAAMLARQGGYHDAYQVGQRAFRDLLVGDGGVLKFWPDKSARRVAIERLLPWQVSTDPNESVNGMPLNFFHRYAYDRFKLVDRFPRFEAEIMTAPSPSEQYPLSRGYQSDATRDLSRMVQVDEAWRVAISKNTPGRRGLCVGNVDLTEGEDWTRPFPPLEFMVWEPWMVGMWGTSLVDIVAPICDELNASYERWASAEKLGSNMIGFYQENTVEKADMQANDSVIWIPVNQAATLMPSIHAPETQGQASQAWFMTQERLAHDVSGVSKQSSSAQREPGIPSASGQQYINALGEERFAIPWQVYEQVMSVGAARQILACVEEIADDGEDVTVYLAAGGILEELKWNDVADYDLPDEAIQVQAVSGLVNTAAQRVDLAERLFGLGILSQDGFLRVIQAKDIDSELTRNNQQSALIERYIEQWLDATKETEESGEFEYDPPIKWMNLEEAIVQVGRAYMQAKLDGAPDFNQRFFLLYLGSLDEEISKREKAKADLAAASLGKPVVAPGAGGPVAAPSAPGLPAPGGAPMNGQVMQ